jgi:hypothetical protein
MGGNRFDKLAQEILKQKHLMDKLEAENRELRQQIADLRSGRGIFVVIDGIRFALRDDSSLVQTTSQSSVPTNTSTLASTGATFTPATTSPLTQQIADAPTTEITVPKQKQSVKEPVAQSNNDGNQKSLHEEPTFLEEIMIDQFNSALTSPNAVWQDPAEKKPSKQQTKPQEPIDEKQKEALRRELLGSYLLE